jgi:hypothetical protein
MREYRSGASVRHPSCATVSFSIKSNDDHDKLSSGEKVAPRLAVSGGDGAGLLELMAIAVPAD